MPLVRTGGVRLRLDGELGGPTRIPSATVSPVGGAPRSLTEVERIHGVHELRGLPPGHVSVALLQEPGGVHLSRVEGAVVVAESITDVGTLHQGRAWQWLELHVLAPSQVLDDVVVWYGPSAGPIGWRATAFDGVIEFAWDGFTALDVVVGAHGRGPVVLTGVREPREVMLVERPVVDLALRGLADVAFQRGLELDPPALTLRFHPHSRGFGLRRGA